MVTRKKKTKVITRKGSKPLHLKLAYGLGRTVQKVSRTVDAVGKSAKGGLGSKRGRKKSKKAEAPKEPLSPILKEMKGIADVSGLTAALQEMNEISRKHSRHPVINRLTVRIQQLSRSEQEMLSRKFVERLRSSPTFSDPMLAFPAQTEMTEEACQKISDDFIGCIFDTLEDVGITPEEREFLKKFSDKMTQPINELVQLYLHPKTFGQKMKRLWRMQRILVRMIKLIHLTNALVQANAGSFQAGAAPQANVPPN